MFGVVWGVTGFGSFHLGGGFVSCMCVFCSSHVGFCTHVFLGALVRCLRCTCKQHCSIE